MSGVRISALPVIPSAPALTDIFPEVQPATSGTTYKTTFQQLLTLFQPSIPLTNAGNPNGVVAGTIYQFLWDTSDTVLYVCTTTGNAAGAVWTAVGGSGMFLPLAGGTMSGIINMGSHKITNLTDPTSAQDAATMNYVNLNSLNGTSVYAASAATLGTVTQSGAGVGATLTNAGAQATFALDGVNPPVGVNVLIKNIATGMSAANEGIYTVTNVGSGASNWVLTRSTQQDTPSEINNTGLIVIQNGSTLAGQAYYNAATIVTVDTTNFSYSRFGTSGTVTSITAGTGLSGGTITSSGTIAASNQCVFAAHVSSNITNATGNGTLATIIADTADANVGSNYNTSTGTFTAPTTGNYWLSVTVSLPGYSVANNQFALGATISGGFKYFVNANGSTFSTGQVIMTGGGMFHMAANDTAVFQVAAYGSTQTLSIAAGDTRVSGFIIN